MLNITTRDLPLHVHTSEPLLDSRLLAQQLALNHRHLLRRIEQHQADYEALGIVRFQSAKIGDGRGRPERYALLNEDQALLVLAYSRNTPQIAQMKRRLVQSFGDARRALQTRQEQYLPGYQAAHKATSRLAEHARQNGSTTPANVHHMNLEKLLNRTVGITAGQRQQLNPAQLTLLASAYLLAAQGVDAALADGADHKQAYQAVKAKLALFGQLFAGAPLLED